MQLVAGLNLNNLKPRVWDPSSSLRLRRLKAVMVSYADFHRMPARKEQAKTEGLHKYLGIPNTVQVYLDNGAFYFLSKGGEPATIDYEEFVQCAKPDWYPIPQDYIPTPAMPTEEQWSCFRRTMHVNLSYQHDGFVPVIHVGTFLTNYTLDITTSKKLSSKGVIALGGIVPNLLRAPKALPYEEVIDNLLHVRRVFAGKKLHVFGIGGTATLHVAALLGIDSADSSGWRNRAARGLIQLPGTGDRMIAELGNWRGRRPSDKELRTLKKCKCPACQEFGIGGLQAKGIDGFSCRATHNLWVLLEEIRLIEKHLKAGTYAEWYSKHLDNTTYLPLIKQLLDRLN